MEFAIKKKTPFIRDQYYFESINLGAMLRFLNIFAEKFSEKI
jgi:hypothetical protein